MSEKTRGIMFFCLSLAMFAASGLYSAYHGSLGLGCFDVMYVDKQISVPPENTRICLIKHKAWSDWYVARLSDGRLAVLSEMEIITMKKQWENWSEQEGKKKTRQNILEDFKKN